MSISDPPASDRAAPPTRDAIEDVQLRGLSRWSPRRAGLPSLLDWWPAYFLILVLGVLAALVALRLLLETLAPPLGETTEKGLYVSYAQRAGIARVPVDELRLDRGPDRNARRRPERTLAVVGGVPAMGVLRHLVPPS